jgi:hypothetical protein
MKNFLKHLITGVILSTIFAIVCYKFFNKNEIGLLKYLINIPIGTITYTIVKSFNSWLYSHFTFFGKNVVTNYIFDIFVYPLVASGWYAIVLSSM